jgi:diacylglycerol kinase
MQTILYHKPVQHSKVETVVVQLQQHTLEAVAVAQDIGAGAVVLLADWQPVVVAVVPVTLPTLVHSSRLTYSMVITAMV